MSLRFRAAHSRHRAAPERFAQAARQPGGQQRGLVKPAFPLARRIKRHRADGVHRNIRVMNLQTGRQPIHKLLPKPQRRVVLELVNQVCGHPVKAHRGARLVKGGRCLRAVKTGVCVVGPAFQRVSAAGATRIADRTQARPAVPTKRPRLPVQPRPARRTAPGINEIKNRIQSHK